MTRSYRFEHVDVFTETPLRGNPLAVFTDPAGLQTAEMQQIALELNLAETVFLFPPAGAGSIATLRIFTPLRELPFAGHPTIGAVAVLDSALHLGAERFTVDEGVGPISLRIERRSGALPFIWLTVPAVELGPLADPAAVARSLGLTPADLHADLPPRYATSSNTFLYVALKDAAAVDRAAMRLDELPPAPQPGMIGTLLFALGDDPASCYTRMFAPQSGIPEDPATGSGTGPLVAYLLHHQVLPDRDGLRFVSRQGVKMGRESALHVLLTRTPDGTRILELGGAVVPVITATLSF